MAAGERTATPETYPFAEIEPLWEERWEAADLFRAGAHPDRPSWYGYEYPPYPNGSLHIGHARNYTLGDVCARFHRMRGFDVLYTQGFDSFGLPNEIAAREEGCHPREVTERSIATISDQFRRLGLSYDRSHFIAYHDPHYYVQTQRIFLALLEADLAYRARAAANWCPTCSTTLADDQALEGNCWRCGRPVETRVLDQWFLRTTRYAQALLDGLDTVRDWPDHALARQRAWIGRTPGVDVRLEIAERPGRELVAFTTQPELIYAMNFLTLALEHPFLLELEAEGALAQGVLDEVEDMRRQLRFRARSALRGAPRPPTRTVALGLHVVHPLTGERLPLLAGNYVEISFATGAVLGAPAHDHKDGEVARQAGIGERVTLRPPDGETTRDLVAYEEDWRLVDAGELTGATVAESRSRVAEALARVDGGGAAVRFRLRDWLVSRQRFWGVPIPIVHCADCGAVPVPDEELPIELPDEVDLEVAGNPLEACTAFVEAPCPRCAEPARRETDTMDTFVNTTWFPWRHCIPADRPFDLHCAEVEERMPADVTIGGVDVLEGAFFHERFLAQAMHELGWIDYTEPVRRALTHEMVIRNGQKMSKSLGNTVDLDDVIERFGADSLRTAIVFMAPWQRRVDWQESKLVDCHRFLAAVFDLAERFASSLETHREPRERTDVLGAIHRETAAITESFEGYRMHVAVHGLMRLRRTVERAAEEGARPDAVEGLSRLVRMLSPLAPHLAEELWRRLGGEGFVSVAAWPEVDAALAAEERRTLLVQVDGKKVGAIEVSPDADEAELEALARPIAEPTLQGVEVLRTIYAQRRKTDWINFVTKARRGGD